MTGLFSFLYYSLLLILHLQDLIGGVTFLFFLLLSLLILLITRIVLRKKSYKRKITVAAWMILLLFCFEFLLIFYEGYTHRVSFYVEPETVYVNSGIYLIGVNKIDFENMESKKSVEELLNKQNAEYLDIHEITNRELYGSKNRKLLELLNLRKNSGERLRENVYQYLGHEDPYLNKFINRDHTDSNSAELGLALTGLFIEGDFQNNLNFAVTGSINKTGDVLKVSGIKEKIHIAEISGFSYMIIPSENAEEAAKIQQEHHKEIQIFDVSHIDEAIQLINELNDKYIQ
ncbi:S16 family serine protease [Psychrobacillus sp. NPDC093180]|uniref:S16 family serine protease n=1 Tax=Psychrobacillus sp. NPDC093180 TaxID=3364489 RepID=UPI003815D0A2